MTKSSGSHETSKYEYREFIDSDIGCFQICATDNGICALLFEPEPGVDERPNHHTQRAKTQLSEYFEGTRTAFDLTLCAQGTEFQRSVWQLLQTIPYGKYCSYGDLAKTLNKPKAMRAVGAANGRNPIPIIVPCHRVIGSDGSLTGFAGGLERKSWLLHHEGALKPTRSLFE